MHRFANPTRFLTIAQPLTVPLAIAGVVLIGIGAIYGLAFSPPDALQGDSVRMMYVHVPAAWLGTGGWALIAAASIAQLVWRHPLAGIAARAVAMPGALFTALCLVTGSLWGRPAWGTWWQWDGRMTSMLILLFVYAGYIALAQASAAAAGGAPAAVSRTTAIFGLVGAINLPIIKYSVTWWHSLHQGPSITMQGSSIAPALLWPLIWTTLGFTALFGAIVLMRMRTLLADGKREARLARMARA